MTLETEMRSLGDEIEFAYGYSLPAHSRTEGKIPVYGSNGQVGVHNVASVSGPGIVIGRKGSVGEVNFSREDFWPIDTTYFVVNKNNHDWHYLYYLLRFADLTNLNSHSAVPGLNREDAYAVQAWFPDKQIQQKVARFLQQVENSMNINERLIHHCSQLKASAMHTLFSRGLRGEPQRDSELGPVPESWDVVALGDLGRVGNGSTPKKNVAAYWENGVMPWFTSGIVYEREINEGKQLVSQVALKECHLPIVKPGAVLIAITGQGKTLGNCAVLNIEATINQHLAYVQINQSEALPGFVRGYLETQYAELRQAGSAGGSTKGALTCGYLRTVPIPKPSIDEQAEIVAILDAIDQKIDLHRRKRAVLEELFKFLLHKLMTGEVWVADLDLSALDSVRQHGAQGESHE